MTTSIANHDPFVSPRPDDRLMSDTTLTKEYRIAHRVFGLGLDDLEKLAINAMKSAFIPYNQRIRLFYDVVKPGYAAVRESARKKRKRTR
jgi:adenosine deaminase